ncbi:MAG: DUF4143 domain-containing protein [Methanomassiliicoccaceae archaeon]|nr:DUF4143 domain-containing protein [Methanomassiliicoccaceae archaeon]
MPEGYRKRIMDKEISDHLELMGAILVEGPKWCGKTRTSKEFNKGILSITNKNQINSLNLLLENGIFNFLDEEPPMLIDEWQLVPGIWDAVRNVVDDRGKRGQFILTGSSVPPKDSEPLHSGAGRIARLTMRTMSLFESGESNGKVSLRGLFDPDYKVNGRSDLSVKGLAAAIARGGWPESLNDKEENATRIVDQYVKAVINSDVSKAGDGNKDPETVKRVIESVARNVSTYASSETIREDVAGASGTFSVNTLKKYLDAMRRIFLIEELPAWNPHMRSRTRLITSSKWHFTDPSIAMSALKASSGALMEDYRTFGLFFESLCVRDLRIYLQPAGGTLSHFRDVNGNEVDLIAELPGKEWGAIEVKLGAKDIEDGAASLIRLKNNIDEEKMKQPSFLMVLTGGQYAMRRPDGVYVVPIGCLGE